MITIYLEEHFLFPKKIIRKELLGRECTMKHLVPGYWECTCCLNAFVALYGSLLQATYVGSWWAGETPWKQRGLSMAFPFSRKVFGTLMGLASILKNLSCDEILRLHACSVNWEGTLLSQLLFSLIAVLKYVLKGKPFVIFLCSHFHKVIQGHYIVHLNMQWLYFLCFQKGFQG